MKKILRIFIVLGIVTLQLLPTLGVKAGTSADVTIIATGMVVGIPGAPGGFTLTYITDSKVGISWTKDTFTANTMIRVKQGGFPTSMTDGYLVYYGPGTTTNDTALNVASPESWFYRAWSENITGGWSVLYSEGDTNIFMSTSFLFIGFILLCSVLTFIAIKANLLLFRLASAGSWLALGLWLLLSNTTNLDLGDTWTQVLGFVFIMMTIAPLTLQMITETKHEKVRRGDQGGYPGASSESWTKWGPSPDKRQVVSSRDRQSAYREKLAAGRKK